MGGSVSRPCQLSHARLPEKQSAHVSMTPAASASCPPGRARTRSTNARTLAGVSVIWRAARSLWSLAYYQQRVQLLTLRSDTGGKRHEFTGQTQES